MVHCAELPREVLVLVLEQLQQTQRLGACATVSRSWRDAAVAATTHICYTLRRSVEGNSHMDDNSHMLAWLARHGQHVSSLNLSGYHEASLTTLPCSQLLELRLYNLKLQLGPGSGQAGVLHACTGLRRLSCQDCVLEASNDWTALAALTGLQDLDLFNIGDTNAAVGSLPPSLLPQLVQLTSLVIGGTVEIRQLTSADSFQHLSCLSQLENLELQNLGWDLTAAACPGLWRLTALQELELSNCHGLDPALLSSLQQLQRLVLDETPILGGAAGTAVLLEVLPHLQLTYLHMDGAMVHCAAPDAYPGLTAASQLQLLSMSNSTLPVDAWHHMCAGGRHLPHITELQLSDLRLEGAGRTQLMAAEQINCLVKCFPSLQVLDLLQDCLQPRAQLTALQQLCALTSLTLQGVAQAAVATLATLTGLVELFILDADASVTMVDLLSLTALQQLTRLYINCSAWKKHSMRDHMVSKAAHGGPPDVWSQILDVCGRASECQPLLLAQQRQQLQQMQAELEHAQAEAARARAEAAQARAEAAQARAEAAQIQAECRQEAAQLQAQVQRLEQAMAAALAKLNAASSYVL